MSKKVYSILLLCSLGLTACAGNSATSDSISDSITENNSNSSEEVKDEKYRIYELAKEAGETRSYEEWLASIQGANGVGIESIEFREEKDGYYYYDVNLTDDSVEELKVKKPQDGVDGKSAYELYKAAHPEYTGSLEEWINALYEKQGKPGTPGKPGVNGKSAFELYQEAHPEYKGSYTEWLKSLEGKDGKPGENGKSAYELYKEANPEYTGTVEEWLSSLKGKDGVDGKSAFELYQDAHPEYEGTYEDWLLTLEGKDGKPGKNGLSAYELYKEFNPEFQGTVEEWLDSLHGKNGVDGKSAFELYQDAHPEYEGTYEDWLLTLEGKDGKPGLNGKSAYELYKEEHPEYRGTLEEWLNSLNGNDGVDGKSAYELYCIAHPEYKGTQTEWVNSLKGKDGADGADGKDGKDGISIVSFTKTSTVGNTDIYTIVFSNGTAQNLNITNGKDGVNGKSAYELYCIAHPEYHGSQAEWLESLKGKDGSNGLNGQDGHDGKDGINGTNGHDGKDGANGLNGQDGQDGKDGKDGQDGVDGKSAYELYKEFHPEYVGTEQQWIEDVISGSVVTKTHNVTFNYDNGEPSTTIKVKHQHKVTKPEVPVKDGYIFDGWYVDDEKWVFCGFDVTNDVTLTAHWTKDLAYHTPNVNVLSTEAIKDKAVNIELWVTGAYGIETFIKNELVEFNKQYPNINVTITKKNNMGVIEADVDNLKLTNALPDIVMTYDDTVAKFMDKRLVVPLDEYMNSIDKEIGIYNANNVGADFLPGTLSKYQHYYNDMTFSLPFNSATEVAYYNKTFMNEFDIQIPKSVNDFPTFSSQVIKAVVPHFGSIYTCTKPENVDANGVPYVFDFTNVNGENFRPIGFQKEDYTFRYFSKLFGGEYFNYGKDFSEGFAAFNNQQTIGGLTYYSNLYNNRYVGFPYDLNSASYNARYMSDYFKNLHCIYTIDNDSSSKYHCYDPKYTKSTYELGVAPVPMYQSGAVTRKVALKNGVSLTMLDKNTDEERLASWLLMRYLTVYNDNATGYNPNAEININAYRLPVTTTGIKSKKYQDYINLDSMKLDTVEGYSQRLTARVCATEYDSSYTYYYEPSFIEGYKLCQSMGNAVNYINKGGLSADKAIRLAESDFLFK